MKDLKNPAITSHALFYDPAYYKMKIFTDAEGRVGPKHYREYPGVVAHDDGSVTFTFYAPNAHSVEMSGGGSMSSEKVPFEKIGEGYWSATVKGIPEGFHYNTYYVDGNAALNPQAPVGYGSHKAENFFERPGPESDFWMQKDVPHGTIHMEHYYSAVTGKTRICWIYTPPEYDPSGKTLYPALYLHHGGGENETGWIWQGKAHYILDNLLAEGKCAPMVVVMNCIYAENENCPDEFLPGDYDSVLVKDCIPFIEKNYRVDPKDEARAMAGLSMGSYQTIMTTLNHLGMFPWVGVFSGTLDRRWYAKTDHNACLKDPENVAKKLKLFFMGAGEQEPLFEKVKSTVSWMDENKIPAKLYHCPGYHEWTVWRKCLYEFAQLIFK